MSSATAPTASTSLFGGTNYFLLRRLHSLTGLVFGGYLVVHLLVNATIAQGGNPAVYQVQVDKIHSLPFLPVIEWGFIYLPIIFHTIYGIWIVVTGQPNVGNYPYAKNVFYVLQRVSAIVIVFFMLFHVLSLKYALFGANLAFEAHGGAMMSVARHMHAHWTIAWLVYPLGILASCYHLANGFWTAAITWGLTISKQAQRRWGVVCAGIFVAVFLAGMIALVAAWRLDLAAVAIPHPA